MAGNVSSRLLGGAIEPGPTLMADTDAAAAFDCQMLSASSVTSLKESLSSLYFAIPAFICPPRCRFQRAVTVAGQQGQLKSCLHMSFLSCLASVEGFPVMTLPSALSIEASGRDPKILRISLFSCL